MSHSQNDYPEQVAFCALNILFGDKPRIGHTIIDNLGSAIALFQLEKRDLKNLFPYGSRFPYLINDTLLKNASDEIALLCKHDCEFVDVFHSNYPDNLKDIQDAPLCLYCKGDTQDFFANRRRFVSILGSDDFDSIQKKRVKILLEKLSNKDFELSLVVDLSANSAVDIIMSCIRYNFPIVGINDKPLDYLWNGSASQIEREILKADKGIIISDIPICNGSKIECNYRQQRIIAGLSDAIIILGGSFESRCSDISKFAFSYGKELFAYPGRIEDCNARTSNYLICRNMAQAIYSTDNLVCELGHLFDVDKGQYVGSF